MNRPISERLSHLSPSASYRALPPAKGIFRQLQTTDYKLFFFPTGHAARVTWGTSPDLVPDIATGMRNDTVTFHVNVGAPTKFTVRPGTMSPSL